MHLSNPNEEVIEVSYIQIKGENNKIQRKAVQTVYEIQPNAEKKDLKDLEKNPFQMGWSSQADSISYYYWEYIFISSCSHNFLGLVHVIVVGIMHGFEIGAIVSDKIWHEDPSWGHPFHMWVSSDGDVWSEFTKGVGPEIIIIVTDKWREFFLDGWKVFCWWRRQAREAC